MMADREPLSRTTPPQTGPDLSDISRSAPHGNLAESDRASRRTACNQCKQQKLRCNLLAANEGSCSRCQRLGIECRVDDGFRRVRKRRRSFELANEVRNLRQQLDCQPQTSAPAPQFDWTLPGEPKGQQPSTERIIQPTRTTGSAALHLSPSASTGPSPGASAEHSRTPGLTTRPGFDDQPEPRIGPVTTVLPRPRALGNTALSVEEIDELFMIYMVNYHPFIPLIDPGKSPHHVYASSELLFWSIVSVASRRLRSQPTLLPKLARSVTDLLWRSLRAIPYSLATVQALILICSWPFPTSSSTSDPTFMLVGTMLQLAIQMGLHRVGDVHNFLKVPLHLSEAEHGEWLRTWQACNIVAQSVSVGCGLPMMIQIHDWSFTNVPNATFSDPADVSLRLHLRIEKFRHRVTQLIGSSIPPVSTTAASRDRLSLYQLLNSDLNELERETLGSPATIGWYLAAARLHLHAFYLLDDATMTGYNDRIISLYQTAFSLIELSSEINTPEHAMFDNCPYFCCQFFVCAAFVVLKILNNGYFQTLIDIEAGRRLLDSSIVTLRNISIANNDLAARLGDVIAFFCTLEDPVVIGGATADDVRLREVSNRLSMSVFYDSLWIWRKHFRTEDNVAGGYSQNAEDKSPTFPQSRLAVDTQLINRAQGTSGYSDMQNSFGSLQFGDFSGLFDLDWPL